MALDEDEAGRGSVADLVTHALSCRADLDSGGDASGRLASYLAYDVSLIRLCERMAVPHDMLGVGAGPLVRHDTERRLADRLPSLAAALGGA